jgi:hypothetical protein
VKILAPVSGNHWAVPDCYFRGLVNAGADATPYDIGEAPTSLVGRILRRFERMTGSGAAKRLEAAVDAARPDILVVFKGFDYPPAVLRRIAARGVILANYNTDHPFRFFSPGSGNAKVRDSVPLYRLYMTYSRPIGRELEVANPEQTVLVLPFGHAIDDALYDELAREAEVVRGCFNGNPDEERADAVRFLADNGVPMDLYGYGWEKFVTPTENLRICTPEGGLDMFRILRRYRFQLNLFRPHNEGSHNLRTFEVPSVGGISLGPDSPEHREFFIADRDAFYFADHEEMLAEALKLLALPVEAADSIRRAARDRTVALRAHFDDRARVMLAALTELVTR